MTPGQAANRLHVRNAPLTEAALRSIASNCRPQRGATLTEAALRSIASNCRPQP